MIDTTRTGPTVRSRRRTAAVLLATSLGFGVVQLDVSVVNVAIHPIGAQLGGDVTGLQWVVDAYTVTFAALILSAGALGDRIGAKRLYLAGLALFTVSSAACGLAPSLVALDIARAVQGIGAAALTPYSLALLRHAFPEAHARARAIGLWAAGASVALSAGPLVGGALTALVGWRAIFLINLPLGVAALALTARWVTESPTRPGHGIDPLGQGLAVVALVAVAWATITAGQDGFTGPVCAGYLVAVGAGAAFLAVEHRGHAPMLPLGLFRSATFTAMSAVGLLVNIAFYGLIFVLSLYFQTVHDYSALATGAAFAPTTVAVLAANLLAGRLSARIGTHHTVLLGAAGMVTGLAALLATTTASTGYATLAAPLTLLGFGLGLLVPTMTTALLASTDPDRSATASGTLNTARQTGSVIGVATFGALTTTNLVTGLRHGELLAMIAILLAATCTLAARHHHATPR